MSVTQDLSIVKKIHGHSTVWANDRRYILKGEFEQGQVVNLADFGFDQNNPGQDDNLRNMLLRKKLLNEKWANLAGWYFWRLIPIRSFPALFLLCLGLCIAGTYIVYSNPLDHSSEMSQSAKFASSILSAFLILVVHETGHIAAALRHRIRVDGVGAGLYLVFPALYTRISLMALLDKGSRIRINSAGLLFQLYLGLSLIVLNLFFPNVVLRSALLINWFVFLLNAIPVLHLDGYRVLNELRKDKTEYGRKAVPVWLDISSAVLTFIFCALIIGSLSYGLYRYTRILMSGFDVGPLLWCLFYLSILLLIGRALPGWIRNPHG